MGAGTRNHQEGELDEFTSSQRCFEGVYYRNYIVGAGRRGLQDTTKYPPASYVAITKLKTSGYMGTYAESSPPVTNPPGAARTFCCPVVPTRSVWSNLPPSSFLHPQATHYYQQKAQLVSHLSQDKSEDGTFDGTWQANQTWVVTGICNLKASDGRNIQPEASGFAPSGFRLRIAWFGSLKPAVLPHACWQHLSYRNSLMPKSLGSVKETRLPRPSWQLSP
ncbi:hypothetical protein CPLU01_06497 [Colletotrichum plurivorum]|uniref:Uncharacterized protein n=1 Tax=Colletotrichum plurivorum TaxID=2175906 RepID=A0A8H6KJ02_9PEZI|nr:hypothetical protein CPLU01_06497 [Colletotrichum plurivorum]